MVIGVPYAGMAEDIWQGIRDKLAEQLGVSADTMQKIKFGKGTAGKITVISVSVVLGIAALGLKLSGNAAILTAMGLITLVFVGAVCAVLRVIHQQPAMAVLEGAELVLYQQVTLAAKGIGVVQNVLPILNPKTLSAPTDDPKLGGTTDER
jgi:hypothetical protein